MNLTDRTYLAVHLALGLLIFARHEHVPHWRPYLVWDIVAILLILLLVA